jgi:hypothetical protein
MSVTYPTRRNRMELCPVTAVATREGVCGASSLAAHLLTVANGTIKERDIQIENLRFAQ